MQFSITCSRFSIHAGIENWDFQWTVFDQYCNININININIHVIKTVAFIIVVQVNRKCMMNELEGTELPMKVPHDAKMTVLIHVVFLILFFFLWTCSWQHKLRNCNGLSPQKWAMKSPNPIYKYYCKNAEKRMYHQKVLFKKSSHYRILSTNPKEEVSFGWSQYRSFACPKSSPIFKKSNIHCTLSKGIKIN